MRFGSRHGLRAALCGGWLALAVLLAAVDLPRAKDLPESVSLAQLQTDAKRLDGQRVVVIGRVQAIEGGRGRRGSEYYQLTLVDGEAGAVPNPVTVFTYDQPPVAATETALIQGTFHEAGRWAGLPFTHFIEADAILRQ